jgi:Polyketide cyclase / dehydrase and lipid transport
MSEQSPEQTASATSGTPSASDFTSIPLRNRIRLELESPVSAVWELMGDLSRFPEYSEGLERVEAKQDADGRCTEYTCYFKPVEEGAEGAVSRDVMKWYEPNRGYLSVELDGNTGTEATVAFMTIDPIRGGSRVTYDMHYDSDDLDTMKAQIDDVNSDMAARLIARFGGRIADRYVEA